MKKYTFTSIFILLAYLIIKNVSFTNTPNLSDPTTPESAQKVISKTEETANIIISRSEEHNNILQKAFEEKANKLQVKGSGTVEHILSDDLRGIRHQRFIIKLSSGQTLLITHNIDLSERIPDLKKGDIVSFYGQYEWTDKGGVIHWTHKDPKNKHISGWLKHYGEIYQ